MSSNGNWYAEIQFIWEGKGRGYRCMACAISDKHWYGLATQDHVDNHQMGLDYALVLLRQGKIK